MRPRCGRSFPPRRNKALLSFDADGVVAMDYMTSERHLATHRASKPSLAHGRRCRFARTPLLGMDADGGLTAWRILCPHPEISWQTLFGKVQYEGYDEPDYVWQTTGGEDYEPKMSLVPLLFGTLKGTFYAMLLAVPLALAAAAYVSHFTTPGFKQWIKPAVEIMAAVPSVVIGFIVALWLAPDPGAFGCLRCSSQPDDVPATLAGFCFFGKRLRRFDWAQRIVHGREFLVAGCPC